MRNFALFIWSFFLVSLIGCSGSSNPLSPSPTPSATTSRISLSDGNTASDTEDGEDTVLFNSHLEVSAGGLKNPIPSLPDKDEDPGGQGADDVTFNGNIWPDEVDNSNPNGDAPPPDAVVDGDGDVESDGVADSGDDDGLIPSVIDDASSGDGQSTDPDPGDDDDDDDGGGDGGIWGEVVP